MCPAGKEGTRKGAINWAAVARHFGFSNGTHVKVRTRASVGCLLRRFVCLLMAVGILGVLAACTFAVCAGLLLAPGHGLSKCCV